MRRAHGRARRRMRRHQKRLHGFLGALKRFLDGL
jgi:hypothetical protein